MCISSVEIRPIADGSRRVITKVIERTRSSAEALRSVIPNPFRASRDEFSIPQADKNLLEPYQSID
jgi:hypothetical protein